MTTDNARPRSIAPAEQDVTAHAETRASQEWSNTQAPTVTRPEFVFPLRTLLNDTYELRCVLGSGGMGQVYEAMDRALGRVVAIKTCWPGIDDQILVQEARVMAAFRESGLTAVHALCRHQGHAYLVMERLVGRSLADHLEHHGDALYDLDEARELLIKITEPLAVLHKANIVHRDLKPSNIMLAPPDRVVLLDFGISGMEQFVTGGPIAGSLHYIAPETAQGTTQLGEAHLSDIFAVGVLAYQLVTGTMPFEGNTVLEVFTNQLARPAPALELFRPDVPPALAELVDEMLSPMPLDRPSADMVVARLRSVEISAQRRTTVPVKLKVRTLVLADEPGRWELLAYVLDDRGITVTVVSDLNSALLELNKTLFHITVADTNDLPVGQSLVGSVRQRHAVAAALVVGHPADGSASDRTEYADASLSTDDVARIIDRLAEEQRSAMRLAARKGGRD